MDQLPGFGRARIPLSGMTEDTPTKILEAARRCLLADGYASMSTRKVADDAAVPLSQIHYHFGSKDELILALLRRENDRLLGRQSTMFEKELPLWQRWDLACDYFDEDIASGYVRVVQEMTAAGWTSESLGKEMRGIWGAWQGLIRDVATDAREQGILPSLWTPNEIVALVAAAFIGAESLILLGMEDDEVPVRLALRKIGDLIRLGEEGITYEG